MGTHLLSLCLQGTWQNNDGDIEEHWGGLHLTNCYLLVCRVILVLEEDFHILVHCNKVIRRSNLQSSAYICCCWERDETNHPIYSRTSSTVLGHSTHFVHLQTKLTTTALAEDPTPFMLLCALQIQTFAASSCPFIFFWGLQKWVWNHSLKSWLGCWGL